MNLVWTSTPPDRPGYYWCQWGTYPPAVAEVRPWGYYGVPLVVRHPNWNTDISLSQVPPGTLWAGPIPEPTDPPAEVVVEHGSWYRCRRCGEVYRYTNKYSSCDSLGCEYEPADPVRCPCARCTAEVTP